MINATQKAFSLEGKTILITGASSGIGLQTAITCSQRGAKLVITGRDAERLQATLEQLTGTGHIQIAGDLTSQEGIERVVQICPEIHGLMHCIGLQRHVPLRQLSEQLMNDIYRVNFLAPVMLTQKLLINNRIAAQGSIIFMLSILAHIGTRGVGPYSAMKSALLGIIRCLALEQAKRKIRVNGISPSAVVTRMWPQEMLEFQKMIHPLGVGEPVDVANAAVYLLADASRWVTGTTLVMDGGVANY